MVHFQNLVLPSNIDECNEMFSTQKHKITRFILKTKILINYKLIFLCQLIIFTQVSEKTTQDIQKVFTIVRECTDGQT